MQSSIVKSAILGLLITVIYIGTCWHILSGPRLQIQGQPGPPYFLSAQPHNLFYFRRLYGGPQICHPSHQCALPRGTLCLLLPAADPCGDPLQYSMVILANTNIILKINCRFGMKIAHKRVPSGIENTPLLQNT